MKKEKKKKKVKRKRKVQPELVENMFEIDFGGRVDVTADFEDTIYGAETYIDLGRLKRADQPPI